MTAYIIYEANRLRPAMARAGEAPGQATTIVLAGRTPVVEHRYLIAAVTDVGEGTTSNEACTRPFPWLASVECA